jgi:hypothetical protein
MSHDEVKAPARKRMAATGEPYAVARREVIKAHAARYSSSSRPRRRVASMVLDASGIARIVADTERIADL